MTDGGVTVSKVTTGSLLLPDIQIMVHHQITTYIPAEKALNSVDLHRALGSGAIFQLLNTISPAGPKVLEVSREDVLSEENRLLREALARSTNQGTALQSSVDALGRQVQMLADTLGRMGTAPIQVQAGRPAPLSEVVGGDVPMFIPETIVPADAQVQVQVQQTVSDGDAVSAAASRLRALRKAKT